MRQPENTAPATEINYRRSTAELSLTFPDGVSGTLGAEFLRVMSPSAEVRGHSAEQATLQTGKLNVGITEIRPAGRYALQLIFDDGHNSGIYTWAYLRDLLLQKERYWHDYLAALAQAGASRDPDVQIIAL